MKRFAFALLSSMGLLMVPSAQASDVAVSIGIGQPGFYGRIDIGNAPQPRLIYAQPVLIERVHVQSSPVYLRVSPGHEKNWRKHCKHYNACGQNVYFVRDDWYRNEYAPHYQEQGDHGKGKGKGKDKDKGKDKGHGHGRD